MSERKVLVTRDYEKFKSLAGNRFLSKRHVRNLVESIEKQNLLNENPIIVTEEMFVIDGQHRLEAAKLLGLEVPYIVVKGANLETVQELNSTMKQWTLRDFCESYAMVGKKDYEDLLKFSDQYGLSLSFAAQLLRGQLSNDSGGQGIVRAGDFKIKSIQNAEETVRRMKQIQPFSDANSWRDPKFVKALVQLYSRGVKHDELVEKFQRSGIRLQRQVMVRDYVFFILDVYNKGRKQNRIDIQL